jgi:glycosyltransferase involved in cell wall biosynthesis
MTIIATPTLPRRSAEKSVRFPLSVIILTHNEAENIGPCLAGLDWADEVIIVDSGSTDGTIARAEDVRPDVRVYTHPFRDFGEQRNWALDATWPQHDWVLFLDADERCTPTCAAAIRESVARPGAHVGFFLTCRNIFLGRWIRHCTLYPSWQLRLLKAGAVRFQKEGHGQREVTRGPVGHIHEPYDHYGFSKGVAHWIDRHNRYSTNELELLQRLRSEPLRLSHLLRRDPLRRRCLKRLAARFGFRPLFRFLYIYILRRGFLDGRAGLLFCLLRVAHEIHITVKLAETNSVDEVPGAPADSLLSEAEPASAPLYAR